jgi:hypothetical protein
VGVKRMQLDTLRLSLIKIGGRVREHFKKVRLHLTSGHSGQSSWHALSRAFGSVHGLHIYAVLPHVVIKGALELMNSGVAPYSCVLSHTFNRDLYRPVHGAASRLQ